MTRSHSISRKSTPRLRPAYRPQPEALEGRRLMSAGGLDPSFGLVGYVTESPRVETSKSHASDDGYALQVLADGSILAAGMSGYVGGGRDFGMIRLTPAGTLDSSFGTGGKVVTDFFGNVDGIYDTAIQADGKIVAVGLVVHYIPKKGRTPAYSNADFGVARYLPNGTLDPAFGPGGNGKVNTNISTFSDQQDEARAVAIQPDGKIVVGGLSSVVGRLDASLVRYDASGKLDPSFGQGGKVVTPVGVGNDIIREIAILPDGKILVVGYATDANDFQSIFIARYGADGNLDPTFGPNGTGVTIASYATAVFASDMALGSDGSIWVTGSNNATGTSAGASDLVLARFTPSGALDTEFGSSGFVAVDRGGTDDSRAIEIQPDGKIVLAGYTRIDVSNGAILARFLADGTLDPSFGNGGVMIHSFRADLAFRSFVDLAIQADGKFVALGTARSTDSTYDDDFLVARYLGDPTPVASPAASLAVAGTAESSHSISPLRATSDAPSPVRQSLTTAQARPILDAPLAPPAGPRGGHPRPGPVRRPVLDGLGRSPGDVQGLIRLRGRRRAGQSETVDFLRDGLAGS